MNRKERKDRKEGRTGGEGGAVGRREGCAEEPGVAATVRVATRRFLARPIALLRRSFFVWRSVRRRRHQTR